MELMNDLLITHLYIVLLQCPCVLAVRGIAEEESWEDLYRCPGHLNM